MRNICSIKWIKNKKPPKSIPSIKRDIKIIDLFSWCGWMTLGAVEAITQNGYNPKINLAIDLYTEAIDVYKKNFQKYLDKEWQILNGDIVKLVNWNVGDPLSEEEIKIRGTYSDTDIIIAWPPCQGHSNLNNYTRRDDPRNELYFKVIRFVEIVRPSVVIIENVTSVLHSKDKVVQKSKKYLEDMGYFVNESPLIVNMSEYGLPQNRKRHIHIAVKNDIINKIDLSWYKEENVSIWEYISDLENEFLKSDSLFDTPSTSTPVNKERIDYLFRNNLYDLPDELRPPCHQLKKHSYNACYGRLNKDSSSPTITSWFWSMWQGRYVHPTQKRVITPHEAARIQGFPDFFSFDLIKKRTMMQTIVANAVPPKIIAMIIDQCIMNNAFNH